MGEIDDKVHYMLSTRTKIRSNLIVKSIVVLCKIVSWLANVRRTVEKTRQTL